MIGFCFGCDVKNVVVVGQVGRGVSFEVVVAVVGGGGVLTTPRWSTGRRLTEVEEVQTEEGGGAATTALGCAAAKGATKIGATKISLRLCGKGIEGLVVLPRCGRIPKCFDVKNHVAGAEEVGRSDLCHV